MGVKCVNALSEWTRVEVAKDGGVKAILFSRGEVEEPLVDVENVDLVDIPEGRDEQGSRSSRIRTSSRRPTSASRRCSTACASSRSSTRA